MFPPSGCAEHHSSRRSGPRADAGQGRMPTISPTGHGWPVGEIRCGREAQSTHQSPQVIDGRRHRVAFLLVTFLWAKPKEKLPAIRAEPTLSAREGTGRAQARAEKFQGAALFVQMPSMQFAKSAHCILRTGWIVSSEYSFVEDRRRWQMRKRHYPHFDWRNANKI